MTGQGMIGRDCAWCGLPAVGEVEVAPAQYRSIAPVDPIIGDPSAYQRLVRSAVRVPACDKHQHITTGQPAPMAVPRGVEQLGMFIDNREERLRNAIYRETGR
ncbi:MAG: hypothetical protein ACR2H2_20175 [Solirubrobacteraceae bacterium]